MRLRNCFLVLACGVSLCAAPSLTAKQVIARSLAARGGVAAFAHIHSLSFTATLETGPANRNALSVWSERGKLRIEIRVHGGKLVQGFDGRTAWQMAPGSTRAVKADPATARQIEDQANGFPDLLADPAAKCELLGQGKLAGHDYYKLRVTIATGSQFTVYVDSHTWLEFHEEYPGGVEEISDYRRVGGVLLPFQFVSGPVGMPAATLTREQITLNPRIPASTFAMPAN